MMPPLFHTESCGAAEQLRSGDIRACDFAKQNRNTPPMFTPMLNSLVCICFPQDLCSPHHSTHNTSALTRSPCRRTGRRGTAMYLRTGRAASQLHVSGFLLQGSVSCAFHYSGSRPRSRKGAGSSLVVKILCS